MYLATILAIWVALTAHFSVSSDASHLPSNALTLRNSENRIKIDLIDVKCDKNENGMHVTIQFSQPFEGIIYSQGYFNDPKCRYVSAGEGDQSYNFVVPFEGCGSKPSCAICDSVDNILVIQQDEEVQGEFDAARKISCSRTGVEEEKKVFFKPFIVQSLDVITVPTKHGGVDCWMDIQRGIYPRLTPIGEVIKIGEELTVIVYLRDPKKEYDLTVRNCWAYDSEDFDDKKTGKVQLSDASGCTMKRKLFGSWHKTDETGSSGATLLLHNTLRAFKFPDESQVYLKCDIEICRGNCAEAICDADEINTVDINKVDCTMDPLNQRCIRDKFNDKSKSTIGFTTIANKIQQPSSTSKVTTRIPFIEQTRRPSFVFTTTQRANYISTTLADQETTTLRPFVCSPQSTDIRCIQQQYTETTQGTESGETTTYQNLFKTTTLKPGYDSFCSLYPKHKRCNQRVTDDFGSNIEILTFKPPSPFATVKYQPTTEIPIRNLEYVSTTETAEFTEQPLNCNGPYLDPRCPNPTPTSSPPTYLPPKTTKKLVISTGAPRRCYPGSLDPRCKTITTTKFGPSITTEGTTATFLPETTRYVPPITTAAPQRPTTTRPPYSFPTFTTRPPIKINTTTPPLICTPNSLDPRCPKVEISTPPVVRPTTRPPYIIKTTKKFFICVPGSNDVNCDYESSKATEEPPTERTTVYIPTRNQFGTTKQPEKPVCFFGSTNPECQKVSTQILSFKPRPTTTSIPPTTTTKQFITTSRTPICYPGSLDSRCIKPTTKKVFVSFGTESDLSTGSIVTSTPSILSTTRAPICYPGSLDTRCQKPSTTQKAVSEVTVTQKIAPETTTYKIPITTGAPICYLGSQDPRCVQSTTKKVPVSFGTVKPPVSLIPSISSTSRTPICYPGSLDPKCQKPTTSKPFTPSISTTQEVSSEQPTTKAYRCYPGSLDPRCVQSTTKRVFVSFGTDSGLSTRPSLSTSAIPSTTRGPICYPGALDPKCRQSTTEKTSTYTTKQIPTVNLISTTSKPPFSTTQAPLRCYPDSTIEECKQTITTPSYCFPGSKDPRCPQLPPLFGTREPATYLPPVPTTTYKTQRPPITTTPAQPFICTPYSLDPRCKTGTTPKFIPSVTTEGTPVTFSPETTQKVLPTTIAPQRPTYTTSTKPPFSFPQYTTRTPVKINTTIPPLVCTPNSLDPRCKTITTTKIGPSITTEGTTATFSPETTRYVPPVSTTTTTQRPTYTTTTRPPYSFPTFTTRPPIKISTTIPPLICTPNSLDPRCRIITTTKVVPSVTTRIPIPTTTPYPETSPKVIPTLTTTTTQRPTYTTTSRPPYTFPTFSTRIISSPQPFTTRPTTKPTSTTTESVLCYPGSTIEGCKQTITTPSFCFPGSKDPRCPQLPPSFSTRQPPTYLPPFPDARLNRVRRQTLVENEQTHEIVKFSLSFKPFNYS